jgi:hypothetical protein
MHDDQKLESVITQEELRLRFLAHAGRILQQARMDANLSVEQLAAEAGVSLELPVRIEAGELEAGSVREFVDLLLVCGRVPLDLTVVPTDVMRRFVGGVPAGGATEAAFEEWQAREAVRRALESASKS